LQPVVQEEIRSKARLALSHTFTTCQPVSAASELAISSRRASHRHTCSRRAHARSRRFSLWIENVEIGYKDDVGATQANKDVLAFAQQMVTDHEAVQKSVIDLAGKLKLTPVENETSKSLKDKSVETTAKMKSLNGKAFDKFYVDNEVAYHKSRT
jgi:hypothetical protein